MNKDDHMNQDDSLHDVLKNSKTSNSNHADINNIEATDLETINIEATDIEATDIEKLNTEKNHTARQQRVINDALAPFEDGLIAQLPTLEQMMERAAQRQQKNKYRVKGTAYVIFASALATAFWLDPAYMTVTETTAIGAQNKIQLSDGSEIHLNTNTKVTVAMHLRSRRLTLHQGEATFHVAHSLWHSYLPRAERPFTVNAGKIAIRDIGTVFNVRLNTQEDVHVSVLTGRVLVSGTQGNGKLQHLELAAGQSTYSQNNQLQPVLNIDPQLVTAWQHGRIYFYNQTLTEVLQELNRYGQLPIAIKDPRTAQLRISAQVDLNDREQFITLLPSFAPVTIHQAKDGTRAISAR